MAVAALLSFGGRFRWGLAVRSLCARGKARRALSRGGGGWLDVLWCFLKCAARRRNPGQQCSVPKRQLFGFGEGGRGVLFDTILDVLGDLEFGIRRNRARGRGGQKPAAPDHSVVVVRLAAQFLPDLLEHFTAVQLRFLQNALFVQLPIACSITVAAQVRSKAISGAG